jgi:hypothetical protein
MIILFLAFFAASIFFFVLGLYRFPSGSFQNVIVILMSMLTMYLAFTFFIIPTGPTTTYYPAYNTIIPNGIIQNPAYNTTQITTPSVTGGTLYWDYNLIFDLICIIFAAVGWVMRLVNKS